MTGVDVKVEIVDDSVERPTYEELEETVSTLSAGKENTETLLVVFIFLNLFNMLYLYSSKSD